MFLPKKTSLLKLGHGDGLMPSLILSTLFLLLHPPSPISSYPSAWYLVILPTSDFTNVTFANVLGRFTKAKSCFTNVLLVTLPMYWFTLNKNLLLLLLASACYLLDWADLISLFELSFLPLFCSYLVSFSCTRNFSGSVKNMKIVWKSAKQN